MDSGHSKFETSRWVCDAKFGDTICDMNGLGRSHNEAVARDDGAADATFIAHARTDIPALLAEVERLRATEGICHHQNARYLAMKGEVERLRGVVAEVADLVREADRRAGWSISRTIDGLPFPVLVSAHDLRAALTP